VVLFYGIDPTTCKASLARFFLAIRKWSAKGEIVLAWPGGIEDMEVEWG